MNPNQSINAEIETKLDAALESIRQADIPEFPYDKIVDQPSVQLSGLKPGDRSWFSIPLFATCAALLLAISIIAWPSSKQSAFAQVQEALNRLKTLQYTVYDIHGDRKTYITKIIIEEPDNYRVESEHGGTTITNGRSKENLRLDHKTKTATFFETSRSKDAQQAQTDLLAFYKNIPAHATERLGQDTYEGKSVEKFVAGAGDRKFIVTVDSQTMLPIKMEYEQGDFKEIITDFIFDAKLDAKLFAMNVPEGYTVKRQTIGSQHPLATKLVVSPTKGLNHLEFGSSIQAVIEFLGEPNAQSDEEMVSPFDGNTIRSSTLYYRNAGLSIFFNSAGMASIDCESHSQVIDFAGKTDQGIGLGDTVEQVINAYGKPEIQGKETIQYIREGLMFFLHQGRVRSIQIQEPVHPSLKIIVNEDGEGYTISAGQAPVID